MPALARWITLAFALLALGLGAVILGYWHVGLKPSLEAEAQHQADLMAQAQADRLAGALAPALAERRAAALGDVLNEVLSFKDSDTGEAFFAGVAIEPAPAWTNLDPDLLRQGDTQCPRCLVAEVTLLDPRDYRLIGVARFLTTDQFLQEHLETFRRHVLMQSALGGALLVAAWAGVLGLTAQMQRQRHRRERAERASAWSQARYERLLNRLRGYFVYARSADGRLLFVSDSVRQVLGCEPEAFRQEPSRFLGAADEEGVAFPLLLGQPEPSANAVVRVRDAWGQARQLECSETLAADAPDGVAVIEGVARDVSAQKELEANLRAAKERAESANRAKTALLANVSHELRTPMSSIIGLAKLLMQEDIPAPQRERANKIRAAADSLLRILDDILDVSKLEAGRLRLEERDFTLDELLEAIASFAAMHNQDGALDIAFAIGPGVPRHLRGDPVRLGQVLLNLTSNALKFTSSGSVLLCIERAPVPARGSGQAIERTHRHGGGERVGLQFALEDSGIGIAPQDLQRLFQPFSQLDESASRTQGGAGLGLAISRHLVGLMGGEIAVESQPQRGSIFRFSAELGWPHQIDQSPEPSILPSVAPSGTHSAAGALVISERELTQALFGQALNRLGLAVALASSGAEALAMLGDAFRQTRVFRLVLVDARLGDAPAAEVARLARKHSQIEPKPAVVLIAPLGAAKEVEARAGSGVFDGVVTHAMSHGALRDALLRPRGLAPSQPAAVPAPRPPAARVPPGTRVLIAEDHAVNREIAVDVLTGLGFEVTAACDGLEALACLEREAFDAVLLDLRMPGLDGIQVTERLRADPRLAHLPVIALTAHGMIEGEHLCQAAGMTGFLSKPLDETELLSTLLPHLEGRADKGALGDGDAHRVAPSEALGRAASADPAARGPDEAARANAPDLRAELKRAMPELAECLARGHRADAIALAQRLKARARDAGEAGMAEALAEYQRALVRDESGGDPACLLESFLS